MGNRLSHGVLKRAAVLTMCAGVGVCAVPAAAGAATIPTITPTSFTSCSGSLKADASDKKKTKDPNLLDYSFSCNAGITAYTLIVTQRGDHGGAIEDFNAAPLVLESDNLTPSPTETLTCSGVLPSNGINCNTGSFLAEVSGGFFVDGTIDPAQAYCKHLPTPAKGSTVKAGTPAIPTAKVQLIVTDWSGAMDGPFALREPKACRAVPNKVPATPSTSASAHSRHARTSRSTRRTAG